MSFSNLEFQEAIPFVNDIRLTIKLDDQTKFTKGKGYFLEEFVSTQTEKKSTRVLVHDHNKKPIFLEIVHGLNENIENIFSYVPKLRYAGTFGLLGIMMPFLFYVIGILAYLFVKMFNKEQMFFSTSEYVIIILFAIVAGCITVILLMVFLRKSTCEAIFEEEDRYQISVDYQINDMTINRNITMYVGETWHIRTNKKKFPRTTSKAFFEEEIIAREAILEKIRNRRIQLEKLFTQLQKLQDKIQSKSRILTSKKESDKKELKEEKQELEDLKEKYNILSELYKAQKKKLADFIKKEAQPKIDELIDSALANWKEKTDELKIKEAEKTQIKHILRMNERITELEVEKSDLKIKSALKDEQISEMRSLSVSTADAIKDVSITATPEGRMRLYQERQENPERHASRININWNKIIPIGIIAAAIILLAIIGRSLLASAAEMSSKNAFFWSLFGIMCILGLTMMFFVFASFVRPFFTREVEVKSR